MNTLHEFKIEDGALLSVPVFEDHSRGKNWLAVIAADPKAPNGLARDFQEKANGRYYYMTEFLESGQPIEFGADYIAASGNRSLKRWYGVIVSIDAEKLVLEKHDNAISALKAAEAPELPSRREMLEAEATRLRARLTEIEKELVDATKLG